MFQTGRGKTITETVAFAWDFENTGESVMIAADGGKEQVQVGLRIEKEIAERLKADAEARGFRTFTGFVQSVVDRFAEIDNGAVNEILSVAYDTGLSPARVVSGIVARWRAYLDAKGDTQGGVDVPELGTSCEPFAEPFDYAAVCAELRREMREEITAAHDAIEELVFSRWMLQYFKAQEAFKIQEKHAKRGPVTKRSKEELAEWRADMQALEDKYDFRKNKEWRDLEGE